MSVEIAFTPVAQVARRTVSDRWKMGQYPFEDFSVLVNKPTRINLDLTLYGPIEI